MCKVYPDLEPLRQCRKSISNLSRFGTALGQDGFNRAPLWMFGTVTSRNNPKAESFMLSRPHWVRNLITPWEGIALVSCDVTGAEDWLAAGFSGDPELIRIYSSGADSYMEFAAVTGAVAPGTRRDKTNRDLETVRAMYKTANLPVNPAQTEPHRPKFPANFGVVSGCRSKPGNSNYQWMRIRGLVNTYQEALS